MQPSSAALAAVLVVLAGCADGGAANDPAAPTGPESATASTTPGPAPAPTPATPLAVPFQWSGHTKEGAWVCMEQDGSGQCPAGQQVAPDGQHIASLPYAGNLSSVELTMAWQADPTQTGLVLAAYGNTTGGFGLLAMAQGDSPVTLGFEMTGLVPDGALVLRVWPEGKTPTSPSIFLDVTQQPFTVDGVLWVRP